MTVLMKNLNLNLDDNCDSDGTNEPDCTPNAGHSSFVLADEGLVDVLVEELGKLCIREDHLKTGKR